jgi:hypothetical protein
VKVDERIAAGIHALLVAFLIATTQAPAHAQEPTVVQETSSPTSIALDEGSGANQPASIQYESPDQRASSLCSLRVLDSSTSSSPNSKREQAADAVMIYRPLSPRCKFDLFLKQTYSPYTFASAGFQAAWADATGRWPHYGVGAQGLAKRLGATLADTESRRFIQTFALSTVLHQDPRYFPSNKRSFIARGWYAVTRVAVTKDDNGYGTFNSSEFLGALFTSSLQNAYYPRPDRTLGDTLSRFAGALSSDAISDLLQEFTPNMKRLFRKHAPKKILKIEERLPIPADEKP